MTSPPFELVQNGRNILRGLSVVPEVISRQEEREVCRWVLMRCAEGRAGKLRRPIFLRAGGARSRGNRRQSLQYGGFFDFNKAAPGKRSLVPPMPPILENIIDRLMAHPGVGFKVLGGRPDQVIVNYYQPGDCIPPHTDHASYLRPIVSLSMLSEQPMLLGTPKGFKCTGASQFAVVPGRAISVPCPRRSLVVLDKESGDVAQHCVPACTMPRISLTFRRDPHARSTARGGDGPAAAAATEETDPASSTTVGAKAVPDPVASASLARKKKKHVEQQQQQQQQETGGWGKTKHGNSQRKRKLGPGKQEHVLGKDTAAWRDTAGRNRDRAKAIKASEAREPKRQKSTSDSDRDRDRADKNAWGSLSGTKQHFAGIQAMFDTLKAQKQKKAKSKKG